MANSFSQTIGNIFKTVGKDGLKVLGFLVQNEPGISRVATLIAPGLSPEFALVDAGVLAIKGDVAKAQAAFAADGKEHAGAEKMAAVLPLALDSVEQSITKAGLVKVDDARFQKAVQGFAQAWVDLMDSVGSKPDATAPTK